MDVGQLTNPAAYTGLRSTPVAITASPQRKFDAVTVLTGAMGAKVIGPLIDSSNSPLDVSVLAVENTYFGNTGVTGLLTGTDLCEALTDADPGRRYLCQMSVYQTPDNSSMGSRSTISRCRLTSFLPMGTLSGKR